MANPPAQAEYLGKMPAKFGIIAAFLGDLDNSDGVGNIYFRQDTSPELLQRIGEQISQAFPDESKLEPTHAVVVTWENIAAQGEPERGDGSPKEVSQFVVNHTLKQFFIKLSGFFYVFIFAFIVFVFKRN